MPILKPPVEILETFGGLDGRIDVIEEAPLNLKSPEFGAIGNGLTNPLSNIYSSLASAQTDYPFVTDLTMEIDQAAFIKALRLAMSSPSTQTGHSGIHFGTGKYIFNQSGAFNNTNVVSKYGPRFTGEGFLTTEIELQCGGSEKWFYDNSSTSRLGFTTFRDLTFLTDSPSTFGCGFKINSTGHEQWFNFYSCYLHDFYDFMRLTGSVGNDGHRFFGCRLAYNYHRLFEWQNPQAVAVELHGCDGIGMYGDVFYIGAGGGGDLHVYGGDWLLDRNGSDTTLHYWLNVVESNNIGQGNGSFLFSGCKYELRSIYNGLVNALAASNTGGMHIKFSDGIVSDIVPGTARDIVNIGGKRRVSFNRMTIPTDPTYKVNVNTGTVTANGVGGHIDFTDCAVPEDLSDKITFPDGYGTASAKGCYIFGNPAQRTAPDFDLWRNTVNGGPSPPTKRAFFKPNAASWPWSSGVERTVKLPINALVTRIVARKVASGVSVAPYQLNVGTNDKVTTWASSTLAQMKDLHDIDVAPTGGHVDVGTDLNKRVVRLWSNPIGDQSQVGGWAWVEYI